MAIFENDKLQRFEDQSIRTAWDEEQEEWYFSVVDVVGVLADSADYDTARKYWNKLKQRLVAEGAQLVTNCPQLKMKSPKDPQGLAENKMVAKQGGHIAGTARENIEAQTGRPVITSGNANSLMLNTAVVGMIEGVAIRDDSDSDKEIRQLEESEEVL